MLNFPVTGVEFYIHKLFRKRRRFFGGGRKEVFRKPWHLLSAVKKRNATKKHEAKIFCMNINQYHGFVACLPLKFTQCDLFTSIPFNVDYSTITIHLMLNVAAASL
jgi:hypothetical protein